MAELVRSTQPTASVELDGDHVVIHDLSVDGALADLVRAGVENGRDPEAIVRDAIEIGAAVLLHGTAKSTVDAVGAEVDRLLTALNERSLHIESHLAVFYDSNSEDLGTPDDKAALRKAEDIDVPTFLTQVPNEFYFKSPVSLVLANYVPERRFVQELMRKENAAALQSWVKAPDVGWYSIEYAYQRGGVGRSKRGGFNPDFFLLLAGSETVFVVETKMDGDVTDQNRGKLKYALAHFKTINQMLAAEQSKRRYAFHFLSPEDYSRFFASLRDGKLDKFVSTLHAALVA